TLARMAVAALDDFRHWSDRYPGVSGFRTAGFLVLLGQGNTEQAKANVAMQTAEGANVEALFENDLARLVPGLRTDDVGVGAYEPDSGYADPWLTTSSLVDGARALGATVALQTKVHSIRIGSGGRVAGVETSQGSVDAPIVLNATGSWADRLSRPLGIPLPVTPQRESIVVFDLPPSIETLPIIADLVRLDYFRPDGNRRVLFGDEDHTQTSIHPALAEPEPGGSDSVSQSAVENAAEKLSHRLPAFGEASFGSSGYTGCYEVTPDFQPVIGGPAEIPGYWYAAGFSGHGFKLTPVVGRLIAEWAADGAPSIPLDLFHVSRFAEGRTIEPAHPYRTAHGLI
ncbi:MAG: FAD-binding oxidoreductase, partial [Rhizobiaceae bacterium]